jgi:hypothetical protein
MAGALRPDGRLPGRLRADWTPGVAWCCLTGNVQTAHCWLMLHEATGQPAWLDAGRRANAFVRRTLRLDGPPARRGGVAGSYPIDGGYGRLEYLNWAAKFAIDSWQLEADLARGGAAAGAA